MVITMTVTIILTLIMCVLLFLMIWAADYFYPWDRLLEFFPKDIEEDINSNFAQSEN